MFTLQNWKVKLAYAAFGCLFGSICTIMGLLASPVTAQRDKFGDIECSSLRVVDAAGQSYVLLGMDEDGGNIAVKDKDGETRIILSNNSHTGWKDENIRVSIAGDELNGGVSVRSGGSRAGREAATAHLGIRTDVDLEGEKVVRKYQAYVYAYSPNRGAAELSSDEHGGVVRVDGHGRGNKNGVWLGINQAETGGFVSVYGFGDSKSEARLGISEDGGSVHVHGKSDGQAVMGINEYGNGAVSTWDKNGYRQ